MSSPLTRGPLAVRRFRALWMASVASNVGSFLQAVAASWLMLELTDSPLWVGAMVASTTLPLLFLALIAGALADLVNRRTVLLTAQVTMGIAATAMAVLEIAGVITPPILFGLGIALGIGLAFNVPAWQAMVPDLVPRGLVASAVALNSVSFNVARAVGPALGGLIVATAGPGLAFTLNALSFVGVVAVIASFRAEDWSPEPEASLGSAIALGLRYARFTAPFRWLLGVAAGFAITSAVVQTMLPNLSRDILGGTAGLYGILLGAMGLGALAGALVRARLAARLSTALVPTGITIFGIVGVTVGLSRSVPLTFLAMAVSGACWLVTLSTLNATTQLLAPAWVRGRVMSLYTLSFVGILPLGSLLAGAIGDALGPDVAIVVLSAAALVLGLATFRIPLPAIDEVETPETARDWNLEPHGSARLEGGPVMIVNTWVISHHRLDEFLAVMDELRTIRLRTGAYRWFLYRNAEDPHRMTELFLLPSWDDHLRQHRRIDQSSAELIREARAFDIEDGPISRHLVAVDVEERPEWDQLIVRHDELHRTDGSIPLQKSATPATTTPVEPGADTTSRVNVADGR